MLTIHKFSPNDFNILVKKQWRDGTVMSLTRHEAEILAKHLQQALESDENAFLLREDGEWVSMQMTPFTKG